MKLILKYCLVIRLHSVPSSILLFRCSTGHVGPGLAVQTGVRANFLLFLIYAWSPRVGDGESLNFMCGDNTELYIAKIIIKSRPPPRNRKRKIHYCNNKVVAKLSWQLSRMSVLLVACCNLPQISPNDRIRLNPNRSLGWRQVPWHNDTS